MPRLRHSDRLKWIIFGGLILILFGLQLRVVDSFVLSPSTTRVLYEWFGTGSSPPREAVERIVVESTSPRKIITPPVWLGWALITLGITMTAYGTLGHRLK